MLERLDEVASICRMVDVAIANGMPVVEAYRAATLLLEEGVER